MASNDLAGKTAFVTGAGTGIGKAIAKELGARGATIGILDIDGHTADTAAAEIVGDGGAAVGGVVDVADSRSVQSAVRGIVAQIGHADIVVNNAGILDDFQPLLGTTEEVWLRVIAVNLTGIFHVTHATLPAMIEAGSGAFVNIASGAGLVAGMGGTAYTSSKHGVIGLTRQIASDYGRDGVRANAICPGSIDTELSRAFLRENPGVQKLVEAVPAGRQGQPEEIAKLAAFLAGPESDFITGAAAVIDGGWTIR